MARQPKHEPHAFAKDPPHGVVFQDGKILLVLDANGDVVIHGEAGELNRLAGGLAVWPSDPRKTSSVPPEEGDENKQTINVYFNSQEGPRIAAVTADMERKKLLMAMDLHRTEQGWRPVNVHANTSGYLTPELMWNLLNIIERTDGPYPRLIRLHPPGDSPETN